jgi:hypothetical protein
MDRFVIRQNIERYAALLKREPDDGRRRTLERLLVEERAKLEKMEKPGDAQHCEDPRRRDIGE